VNSEYSVGYGRPPKETRFSKGRSGNPSGRPKGKKNLVTSFMEVSREPILVTEGGRSRKIAKGEAILRQLINRALSGDTKAVREYFQIAKTFQRDEEENIGFDPKDKNKQYLESFVKRMKRLAVEKDLDSGSPTEKNKEKS
jgi:hypothetical protein